MQLVRDELHLLYVFPAPDASERHTVHSKGLLIRDPNGDSINVTSRRSLAPASSTGTRFFGSRYLMPLWQFHLFGGWLS
jgi:hypothetical protein